MRRLLQDWDKLFLKDGILFRRINIEGIEHQLVLPRNKILEILKSLHDDSGHQGHLHLVRSRFFWTGMSEDVEKYVKNCGNCVRRKAKTSVKAALLVSIHTLQPMELVCLDNLKLEEATRIFL